MKNLLICLGLFSVLSAMDVDPKYKGRPSFTHFHVQDGILGQTKGVFTVFYTHPVITVLKHDEKSVATILVEEEPQRILRSFPSVDAYGCSNKEVLVIDRH
jgi:hypothetical protein